MEDYNEQAAVHCLECGTEITYGRSDKKFCCRLCKDTYNNRIKQSVHSHKIRVDSIIHTNYNFLNNLIKLGVEWIPVGEASAAGFKTGFVTSYSRIGDHYEYACYDIYYRISLTRIFNIRRMSLNLPPKIQNNGK